MDPIPLFVPDSVPKDFINLAVQLGVLTLVPLASDPFALFDRTDSCACCTRDLLAIQDRCILAEKTRHRVLGYPLYALPTDCTVQESVVALAWLLRFRKKSFRCEIKDGTLVRSLETDCWFKKSEYSDCCDRYALEKDPVFMLEPIVLSQYGKGPTLESCLLKP